KSNYIVVILRALARKNPADKYISKGWIASHTLAMTTLLQDYLIPRPWWERGRMRGQKAAFTLAEVLITLAIIGIVAAMTIPNLMTNYKKRATVARVKAAYSIFSQAVKLSVEENGEVSGWDFSNPSVVAEKYITPYMTGVTKQKKSLLNYPMRTLSSQGIPANNIYLDWSWNITATPIFQLQNGMFFVFANSNDGYPTITVDINGADKPNIVGIDGFVFWIEPKSSSVVPAGYNCSREGILSKGCPTSSVRMCRRDNTWQYYRGGYCAALMQKDGWTIGKDYPWGNGGLTKK
ncbi:MAG: type II secretion system GspH family protein, partial [Muribaculaceae bacterium]|nr:type II secretion system GspH family protein [Muribaculaceae bacterium]